MEIGLESRFDTARILVVDDQEPFLKLYKRFFHKTNYHIDTTTRADEVIKLIENGEKYDLIVLDVMMPILSGYEVCRLIRKKYDLFEMPVLFLTARRESEDLIQGFTCGGNDYVTKPFEPSELLARTETLVRLKKLYDSNNLLNNELKERNKFLQMNIHDLKNPLTSIMVLTSVVQKELDDENENNNNLKVIQNSSEYMLSLVNQILEVTSLENQEINLNFDNEKIDDLISQVIDLLRPQANQKTQSFIIKRQYSESPIVYVDSEKIIRTISNIVGNAIKFSPQSSTINISTKLCNTNDNSNVIIEISDNGPGFTESDRKMVFNRFGRFTARPTAGEASTGLGLLIAKQLIEANNGQIWLDDDYRNGSKFVIKIPIIKNN